MPIETRTDAGGLETLSIRAGDAQVDVVPARGALVSRFRVGGDDVLFLDEATLADRTKNVRGGIPLLFPVAGKLPGGRYEIEGQAYELPQHGFARKRAWSGSGLGERVLCTLVSDAETRAVFPFDFEATLDVSLDGPSLSMTLAVFNRSTRPMPFHAGMHPYFLVPEEAKPAAGIETDATRAYDNVNGLSGPLGRIDLTAPELDLHLENHHPRGTVLRRGPLPPITLAWSENVSRVVLWTLRGRDFVCVEPWTGPGGALASGAGIPWIPPGETQALRFRITSG